MKHYKSVIWKHPLMFSVDIVALVCLRREAGLEESGEVFEPAYTCGYVNSYTGPQLSEVEMDVLMLEEIK